MDDMFSAIARRISLTPCFSWMSRCGRLRNRFNGLPRWVETVETVPICRIARRTQLKLGVNESIICARSSCFGISALAVLLGIFSAHANRAVINGDSVLEIDGKKIFVICFTVAPPVHSQ